MYASASDGVARRSGGRGRGVRLREVRVVAEVAGPQGLLSASLLASEQVLRRALLRVGQRVPDGAALVRAVDREGRGVVGATRLGDRQIGRASCSERECQYV